MSIFSTLRAAHYLASDILPALRRFAAPEPDDADPYAEWLARAHAELPGADCGLGEADECLCDSDGCLSSCDTCSSIADIGAEALAEQLGVESIFRSGEKGCEPASAAGECDCGTCTAIAREREARAASIFHPGRKGCEPPSAADEPAFIAWLASVDARLAAIQDHLTSAAPGATFTPAAAPESPAPDTGAGAGHPGFPDWCAAEMRQVADILLTADSPFRVGYANDLRRAADEHDDDPGSERGSWPWTDDGRRK